MGEDRFWAAVKRYRAMPPEAPDPGPAVPNPGPCYFTKACVHFVGFRGDEYAAAVRIWGRPDFIHRYWDHRAIGDIVPDLDTVVFARGDERDPPNVYAFNDSEVF